MASWHPEELWREVEAYLAAVTTIREELLRDPVWMPEPCFVPECEHLEGVA